jgi:hypothetical protein
METFKPVVGFEGVYSVSDTGRVVSLSRIDSAGKTRVERVLKPTINKDGYAKVNFWDDGRCYRLFLHRIVHEAFIGPIPDGYEINHLNGIRNDNRPANLSAVTHAENVIYSRDVLKANYATYGNGRMTRAQIDTIKELAAAGISQREIATQLGFAKASVWNVLRGKTWAHIG